MLQRIRHNGIWRIKRPDTNSLWRVDHTHHVLTCIYGQQDEMFEMVTITCKKLGYTTRYEVSPAPLAISAEAGSGKTAVHLGLPLTQL